MGGFPVYYVWSIILFVPQFRQSQQIIRKERVAVSVETWKMYINGEWVEAASGEYYDDFDPYTGELFARVAAGGAEDAKRAVDAAAAARGSSSTAVRIKICINFLICFCPFLFLCSEIRKMPGFLVDAVFFR